MKRALIHLMAVAAGVAALAGCGGPDSPGEDTLSTGDEFTASLGLEILELVGPAEERAGKIPVFEWEPVQGAAAYRLVVRNAAGGPIWAWQGTDTSVTLGGIDDRPPGAGGPVITDGSRWSVAALDADDHVTAISEERAVSP
jgi:hypothetical protein